MRLDGVWREHAPDRPAWTCTGCGRLWPCHTARDDLALHYEGQPTMLSLHMSSLKDQAHHDLTANLDERFLAWVLPATGP